MYDTYPGTKSKISGLSYFKLFNIKSIVALVLRFFEKAKLLKVMGYAVVSFNTFVN